MNYWFDCPLFLTDHKLTVECLIHKPLMDIAAQYATRHCQQLQGKKLKTGYYLYRGGMLCPQTQALMKLITLITYLLVIFNESLE